ncbi:hypothetical protein [Vibrio sp. C8]
MKIRIDKSILYTMLYILIAAKVIVFFYIINFTEFGLTKDAVYYDELAKGDPRLTTAVNYWPIVLNFFYNLGLYSRESFKCVNLFIATFIIPLQVCLIYRDWCPEKNIDKEKTYLLIFIIINLYAQLFLNSLDIVRELPMLLLFLVNVHIFLKATKTRMVISTIYMFFYFLLSWHMYEWREYLGFTLFVTPLVYMFVKKIKLKLLTLAILYIIALTLFYKLGFFEPILVYRGEDGFESGRASLGIGLIDRSAIEFVILYIYSTTIQLLGFYFSNYEGVFLFLLESLPFLVVTHYIAKNIRYLDDFGYFLLTFFFVYLTFWSLGTDNIGTGMRLRIFNYLSIFLIYFLIRYYKARRRL